MTLQEDVANAIRNTPVLMGGSLDHEGMAQAAIDCIVEKLLSDEVIILMDDIAAQHFDDIEEGKIAPERKDFPNALKFGLIAAIEAVKNDKQTGEN